MKVEAERIYIILACDVIRLVLVFYNVAHVLSLLLVKIFSIFGCKRYKLAILLL